MSDEDTSQERTEQATPKREEEARSKGQVSRSRELNTMAILMASAMGFLLMGRELTRSLQELMQNNFSIERSNLFDNHFLFNALVESGKNILFSFSPFILLLICVAFFAPMIVGGWIFSPEALAFKFEKLNPLAGFKRQFSARSLMEFLKTLAKFLF